MIPGAFIVRPSIKHKKPGATLDNKSYFAIQPLFYVFGFERCCKNWKMKGDEMVNFKHAEKREKRAEIRLSTLEYTPVSRAWPSDRK